MQTAAYVIGLVLLFGALVIGGAMLLSDEPFDPTIPCTMLIFGGGIFGFGWLSKFSPSPVVQCAPEKKVDSAEALDIDE